MESKVSTVCAMIHQCVNSDFFTQRATFLPPTVTKSRRCKVQNHQKKGEKTENVHTFDFTITFHRLVIYSNTDFLTSSSSFPSFLSPFLFPFLSPQPCCPQRFRWIELLLLLRDPRPLDDGDFIRD